MVAINLFHEPSFSDKLSNIGSLVQICALLAALVGYASRFYPLEVSQATHCELQGVDGIYPTPEHFIGMALKLIDAALAECGDEAPPICVVQALIIATHCHLTRGVHGRAWRSLGLCVRLAYELNLHLVDAQGVTKSGREDPIQWRDDEEKRRAWWAIWEMDVFASTIRRTPPAIAWAQMETLLPVDDADWFKDRVAPSAFMESDAVQRWKSLRDTGNQSPKAWFLVINSLMKDAQVISCPRGVYLKPNSEQRQAQSGPTRIKARDRNSRNVEEACQRLEMLANAVQCFVLALPTHLRYRNQYLGFDPPVAGQDGSSLRQLHCGIYNIFVMTQLARLMIHRYAIFGGYHTHDRQPAVPSHLVQDDVSGQTSSGCQDPDNPAVMSYFEAADNILMIVNRSCEEHIQHINPFLPSTIWLAAAVQLVRKYIGRPSVRPELIKSRFDVLYLTYKRCVTFWDAKTAMEQNLEALEMQLEGHYNSEHSSRGRTSCEKSKELPERVTSNDYQFWAPDEPTNQNPLRVDARQEQMSSIAADRGQSQMLAQQDSIPAVSVAEAVISPALFDGSAAVNPMAADGIHQDLEWRSLDLPLDIQDLLSGFSTY
ncbi:putative Fungal specific transcription factor [Pleurostoma richardsiae]|uniref:Fungal specific transcription factor n=1 Tax=Pleurostoma richardsiae TaxID=41990 RepID=A0AA38VHI2_9PEZI|nr:putative Fungal specific transcription factor [Pleurostoma richardsiae]